MKQTRLFSSMAVIVLSAVGFVLGQGTTNVPARPGEAQQPPSTINAAMDREISTVEKEVVEAAEAMPESKFNFSPEGINVQGSDYKGVRTFALQSGISPRPITFCGRRLPAISSLRTTWEAMVRRASRARLRSSSF